MTVTITLAIVSAYSLYFMWLISTNEQDTRHMQELADANKHKQQHKSVNDYFFSDDLED
jgi:hypothetical protein